jgi:hypothetical protein
MVFYFGCDQLYRWRCRRSRDFADQINNNGPHHNWMLRSWRYENQLKTFQFIIAIISLFKILKTGNTVNNTDTSRVRILAKVMQGANPVIRAKVK